MSNPILEWMQENLGKTMSEAPSPVARWLKGTLRDAQEGALVADFVVRPETCPEELRDDERRRHFARRNDCGDYG